jgi:hypothetical protein
MQGGASSTMSEGDNNSQGKELQTSWEAVLSLWLALAGLLALFLAGCVLNGAGASDAGRIFLVFLVVAFQLCMVAAFVMGIVGAITIRRSKGQLEGKGFAAAGIALPAVAALGLIMLLPRMKSPAWQLMCGTNLNWLSSAMNIYASEFDDKYPTPDKWCDLLIEHAKLTPKHFVCLASDATEGESSYALNENIGDKSSAEMPPDVVVLFETNLGKDASGRQEFLRSRDSYKFFRREYKPLKKVYKSRWNQYGGPEILTTENHMGKGCNILFNAGYVRFVPTDELSLLKWSVREPNDVK